MLKIGSLFAGIGGLDLGLETGLAASGLDARTVFQVERAPYSREVLARHWPKTRRYDDVTTMRGEQVDVLEGGFPCTDLSLTGPRTGLRGARSGLWSEFARLVEECGPRAVVIENVPGLLCATKTDPPALYRVLADLDEREYDALWTTLSAEQVGAPHLRVRVFVVGLRRELPLASARATRGHGPPTVRWPSSPGASEERQIIGAAPLYHLERIEALGNVVVPQVAHVIGRMVGALLGGRPGAPKGKLQLDPAWQGEFFAAWAKSVMSGAIDRIAFSPSCSKAPAQGTMVNGVLYRTKPLQADNEACSLDGCDAEVPRGRWPTCTARDWRSGKSSAATRARNARPLNEMAAPQGILLPTWTERLMGFPEGYTEIKPGLVTPRKRSALPKEKGPPAPTKGPCSGRPR